MITNSIPIEVQQNESSFIEAAGPSSQNQVALPVANNNVVRVSDLSSDNEWSSSDEDDGGQVAQIRPQASTENRVQVNNTYSGCMDVNPTVNNSTIYKDGATINNNYYCCSLSIGYVGNWCKKRRKIVIITLSVLAILLTISLAIWISVSLKKTDQSDNAETETTLIMPSTETMPPSTTVIPPSSTDTTNSTMIISTSTDSSTDPTIPDVRIVSRTDWLARPPKEEKPLSVSPVNLVIIMHTGRLACFDQSECANAVKSLQEMDMDNLGKTDISYNWLVGGDGLVYTGRGWNIQGDHTKGYDNRTIGIAFIGNFGNVSPTLEQIDECKKLIQMGVDEQWIEKGYKLVGQKQCNGSNNPGDKLYNIIKDWPGWAPACFWI